MLGKSSRHRIKYTLGIIFGFFIELFALCVYANEVTVIEVHRNIPLSDSESIYKDFYLNGGNAVGFKKNMVVNVVRKIEVKDAAGVQSYGDIIVPVGQLKIIAVFDKISVAREFNMTSRESEPLIEQIGIMTGDRIQSEGFK